MNEGSFTRRAYQMRLVLRKLPSRILHIIATMSKSPGLIVVVAPSLSNKIAGEIEIKEQFTDVVIYRDLKPKKAELALVSLGDNELHYFAVCQKGRAAASGKISITFSNFVELDALPWADILNALPKKFQRSALRSLPDAWRPSAKLWEEICELIARHRTKSRPALNDLRVRIEEVKSFRIGRSGGLESLERDAIATALQTFGGPSFRKQVLRGATASKPTPVAPFLTKLEKVKLREDPQINHDHTAFPEMVIKSKDVIGSVVLHNPSTDEYLTLLNCNRQPLETTLGVDLIYYNHIYNSYVCVQYKRMSRQAGKTPVYRPKHDRSYKKGLAAMTEYQKRLDTLATGTRKSVEDFRLHRSPFYFKLCLDEVKSALDAGMVSGLYIPVRLWRRIVKAIAAKESSVAIGWDNCPRRLNNSEFTSLLRRGWIGTSMTQSADLSAIIETVLASGRMLVLAKSTGGASPQDHRRDGAGKFAAEDDPAGAI